MSHLINTHGEPLVDGYTRLADDAAAPDSGAVIVSLARWQAESALAGRAALVAVELANTVDVLTLDAPLMACPMLVLQAPAFSDGRAFSQAYRLRSQRTYKGVLRVSGPVLPDQILEWGRCGVDEVETAKAIQLPASFAVAAGRPRYQPDVVGAVDARTVRQSGQQ
jgi:uncharacterized protein (DUF934 family)